jgi:hypothetical protein
MFKKIVYKREMQLYNILFFHNLIMFDYLVLNVDVQDH